MAWNKEKEHRARRLVVTYGLGGSLNLDLNAEPSHSDAVIIAALRAWDEEEHPSIAKRDPFLDRCPKCGFSLRSGKERYHCLNCGYKEDV